MSAAALIIVGPLSLSSAAYFPPVRLACGTEIQQGEKRHMLSKEGVEELEGELLKMEGSTECSRLRLSHHFAPGIYVREIFMPAGEFIIGAEHTTEHFNIVLTGKATIIADGEVVEVVAPATFVSRAGVRKVLQIHSDMIWQTVHANPENETDTAKLESKLCRMSATHKAHFEGMKEAIR